ncbi:hypothetical protein J2T57_004119 [Natronocella acetinitrilica]|uniref:Uncharacterized protein n=1 Tax=Natronocella acetinitrilica TaxID=414046 RepID=A0AAE3G6U7_9GAMM|nr:hypothetical protein [Natronocella acetinitrilica]MCP1676945.1 hypothetical protein [Natronocella acetinitrilica]
MRGQGSSAIHHGALRASIRGVESRIRRRQGAIGIALGHAAHEIGERVFSPAAILAAGLLGAAIQRDHRLHIASILSILQTANTSLRLLLTLTSETAPPKHDQRRG